MTRNTVSPRIIVHVFKRPPDVNCRGNHWANASTCPEFAIQKEIREYAAFRNLPLQDANEIIRGKRLSPSFSFLSSEELPHFPRMTKVTAIAITILMIIPHFLLLPQQHLLPLASLPKLTGKWQIITLMFVRTPELFRSQTFYVKNTVRLPLSHINAVFLIIYGRLKRTTKPQFHSPALLYL